MALQRLRQSAAALSVALLLLLGCGSAETNDDAAGTTPEPGLPEEQKVAEVAVTYLEALAANDWKAACSTRTEASRLRLSKTGNGSCARGLGSTNPPSRSTIEVDFVEVDGSTAEVHFKPESVVPLVLEATLEDGEWRLIDSGLE